MKIQSWKTKLIAPVLLLIPMASMHLGDGHPPGLHHSLSPHPSFQSPIHGLAHGDIMGVEGMTIPQDGKDKG